MKKQLLFVGLNAPRQLIQTTCNEVFGKNIYEYVFVDNCSSLKNFSFDNHTGKQLEAIFIGPVPHKSTAGGGHISMVSPECLKDLKLPVYVLYTSSKQIKFTKTSIKQALKQHQEHLKTTHTLTIINS